MKKDIFDFIKKVFSKKVLDNINSFGLSKFDKEDIVKEINLIGTETDDEKEFKITNLPYDLKEKDYYIIVSLDKDKQGSEESYFRRTMDGSDLIGYLRLFSDFSLIKERKSLKAFNKTLKNLEVTISHELAHMVQEMIRVDKGSLGGLPKRKLRSTEADPFGYYHKTDLTFEDFLKEKKLLEEYPKLSKRDKRDLQEEFSKLSKEEKKDIYDKLYRVEHDLQDIELQTLIIGSTKHFSNVIDQFDLSKDEIKAASLFWMYMLTIDKFRKYTKNKSLIDTLTTARIHRNIFNTFYDKDKNKMKYAMKMFYKEIEKNYNL